LPQQSRRRFLYVAAGIASVAGIGYLTVEDWRPALQERVKELYSRFFHESSSPPTPLPTPTETASNPPESATSTSTVTSTQQSTISTSKDEIMIRELMDAWRNLYSTGNTNNTFNVYTDDAILNFGCSKTGVTKFSGPAMISSLIKGLYAAQRGKMDNQRIIELTIQGNEAYVVSYEDLKMNRGIAKWLSKFKLRKISEIKRGPSTFKLSKPIWRIQDEYSHCASDG